jgi:hypothetical protein
MAPIRIGARGFASVATYLKGKAQDVIPPTG